MAELQAEIRATLETLNEQLRAHHISKYRLELYDPAELSLLKRNARFMRLAQFRQLVANIQKDGQLESLPLVYLEESGTRLVLSGNHRVQAARRAGVPFILCLVIDWKLSQQERTSKQLAHNAIDGEDDLATLKELWSGIDDVRLKVAAGIDERTVKLLDSVKFPELKEEPLRYKAVALLFLQPELEDVRAFLDLLGRLPSSDQVWLADVAEHEKYFKTLIAAKGAYDVVNTSSALLKLIHVAAHHLHLDGATDPMDGVRKTEVRCGEHGGQVARASYDRWMALWQKFTPAGAPPTLAFAQTFEHALTALENASAGLTASPTQPGSSTPRPTKAAAKVAEIMPTAQEAAEMDGLEGVRK